MPKHVGVSQPTGQFTHQVIPRSMGLPSLDWHHVKRLGLPAKGLPDEVNEWRLENSGKLLRRYRKITRAAKHHVPMMVGSFSIAAIKRNGEFVPYGLAGFDLVTVAFVEHIVDDMVSSTANMSGFKWHNSGLSATGPAATDTQLGNELTSTEIAGGGRVSGTQVQGGSSNIYETVGTITINKSTVALRESAVFSSSSTGSGIMVDRDIYAVINLSSGESLQTTYDLTYPSGG